MSTTNESIWNDIRRRGNGSDIKKEDNVNNMGVDDFVYYLVTNYRDRVHYMDKDHYCREYDIDIVVDPIKDIVIYGSYVEDELARIMVVFRKGFKNTPDIKRAIDKMLNSSFDQFDWEKKDTDKFVVREKDGKDVTNQTYINLIEFFLNNEIFESVWGDIRRRGNGEEVKKEDDINTLDINGFYEYLSNLEGVKVYIDGNHKDYISIDDIIISATKRKKLFLVMEYSSETEKMITLPYSFSKDYENIYDKMLEEYSLEIPEFNTPDEEDDALNTGFIEITPRDGSEVTNKFFLDVLNFILVNCGLKGINESVWSDIRKRGNGEEIKKEDEISQEVYDKLDQYLYYYAYAIVSEYKSETLDGLCDYLKDQWGKDPDIDQIIEYVKDNWADEIVDSLSGWVDQAKIDYENDMNESVWNDIRKRGNGDVVRKEDDMTDDDFLMLRETAKMFRNVMTSESGQKYASRINGGKPFYIDDCDSFIKYISIRKKEQFWNDVPDETYDKVMKFVEKNWKDCKGIQDFMDKYLSGLNECDGVPGGITPADVGGMGAAYFPGPNGEPGSGDLPSPTGVVYHQIAPYTVFIKELKKKKKKKKFRKEDEPCAKYDNPPIYKHVDDFRDYVDRTYTMVNKKK